MGEIDLENIKKEINKIATNTTITIKDISSKRIRSVIVLVKRDIRSNTLIYTIRLNDRKQKYGLSIKFVGNILNQFNVKRSYLSIESKCINQYDEKVQQKAREEIRKWNKILKK